MKQLLTELFETYYKDIYGYLYSLCRDASLAEDLTSEVFLEVVRSLASFRGESDVKTWLFSIARHRWYAWLRKQNRQIPTQSIHELWETAEPGSEEGSAAEAEAVIRAALAEETAVVQRVVQLRIEGYSYHEIAAQCGISENSARVVFFRAKTRIKKHLEKEGFRYE
jgi:RNA polymerase sigma-70 factor (ECF subfamily)